MLAPSYLLPLANLHPHFLSHPYHPHSTCSILLNLPYLSLSLSLSLLLFPSFSFFAILWFLLSFIPELPSFCITRQERCTSNGSKSKSQHPFLVNNSLSFFLLAFTLYFFFPVIGLRTQATRVTRCLLSRLSTFIHFHYSAWQCNSPSTPSPLFLTAELKGEW